MTFIQSIKTCFRKYFDFKGRASRSEFWWFWLFNILMNYVLGVLGVALLNWFWAIIFFIPAYAVGARRLHDRGRSGWWQIMPISFFALWIVAILTFASSHSMEELRHMSEFLDDVPKLMALFGTVPILAAIVSGVVLIVWWCKKGEAATNKYGSPLGKDGLPIDDEYGGSFVSPQKESRFLSIFYGLMWKVVFIPTLWTEKVLLIRQGGGGWVGVTIYITFKTAWILFWLWLGLKVLCWLFSVCVPGI